jgi:SAM-dependent methyltransferase
MGVGAKNLEQIMLLTERGLLPAGGAICDIGASELQGAAIPEGIRSFLDYYARAGAGRASQDVAPEVLEALANRGFLGDLMILAGFEYKALDIFQAPNTILFDLNAHEPGPALVGRFDLVLNFGTTEHVVNQYLALRTIYDLLKVGGVAYHDLPMSGFSGHGYFKYDPQLFVDLARANAAEVVIDRLTAGHEAPQPSRLARGAQVSWRDYGVEFAMRRTQAAPMRLPLETSTSLAAVDPAFATAHSDSVRPAERQAVVYESLSAQPAVEEVAVEAVVDTPGPRRAKLGALLERVRGRAARARRA